MLVFVDGFLYRVPRGAEGVVSSFSGPEAVATEVKILGPDCTLLGAGTWPRDRGKTLVTIDPHLAVTIVSGEGDESMDLGAAGFPTASACGYP